MLSHVRTGESISYSDLPYTYFSTGPTARGEKPGARARIRRRQGEAGRLGGARRKQIRQRSEVRTPGGKAGDKGRARRARTPKGKARHPRYTRYR